MVKRCIRRDGGRRAIVLEEGFGSIIQYGRSRKGGDVVGFVLIF